MSRATHGGIAHLALHSVLLVAREQQAREAITTFVETNGDDEANELIVRQVVDGYAVYVEKIELLLRTLQGESTS